MPADDAMLFIDANKYIDLYRTATGNALLAPLKQQSSNIFITQQIVAEVERNKVKCSALFLDEQFKPLQVRTYAVPDHLFAADESASKQIQQKMGELAKLCKSINTDIDNLARSIMAKIARSEDEVSAVLAPIFSRALPHTDAELQRARVRKEHGHPPGKKTDPIGDELNWEQLLAHFAGKKRLWIVSRDGDYGSWYGKKAHVNRYLYNELSTVSSSPQVYLYSETIDAITHFAKDTGVGIDTVPGKKEATEIRREELRLPPLNTHRSDMSLFEKFKSEFALITALQQMNSGKTLAQLISDGAIRFNDARNLTKRLSERLETLKRATPRHEHDNDEAAGTSPPVPDAALNQPQE